MIFELIRYLEYMTSGDIDDASESDLISAMRLSSLASSRILKEGFSALEGLAWSSYNKTMKKGRQRPCLTALAIEQRLLIRNLLAGCQYRHTSIEEKNDFVLSI